MAVNGNNIQGPYGPPPPEEPTIHDYLAILFRGKWVILATLFLVTGATALFTFLQDPIYESTASVLVNTEGKMSAMPLLDITGGIKNIKNELEILKSYSLGETVVKQLLKKRFLDDEGQIPILIIKPPVEEGGTREFATVRQIVGRLTESVNYEPVRDSDVIKITAKSKDPEEAALIANTFAEVYSDRNLNMSRMKSRVAREFLDDQVKSKRASLKDTETDLRQYMEKKGIVLLDEEAKRTINQLAQLEASRDAVDVELRTVANTLASYEKVLTEQEVGVAKVIGESNDSYIRRLQEEIALLEVQRDVTIAQNPAYAGREIYTQRLKEIDDQIVVLRQKLQTRTDEFLQSVVPAQLGTGQSSDPASYLRVVKLKILESQIQIQALQAKKKAVQEVIKQYEKNFENIPEKSIEYARLQRARLSSEKLYLLVEEKFNEVVIAEQSEFGYIDIFDPAIVPVSPVSPKKQLNLMLGILVGLGLGIVIAFVRERFDVKIRTPEDLKKRGHILLSSVMLMDEELKNQGGKTKVTVDGKELDAHLLTFTNPISSVAETFRRLRTNIQYARIDHDVKTLLVTSPNPSEGKSTVVSNLAIAYAQSGKKVLLIDTDLYRPSLHLEFDLQREPGLCNILRDGELKGGISTYKTVVDGLEVITCGEIPPNPAEVLGSQKMVELIEMAKKKFDVVLLDSPPVLAVTDPTILSTFADGTIVVVSANITRIEDLERALESLEGVGAKTMGVVLNNFDIRKAFGGYYGSYGYRGYRYHSYGYQYSSQPGNGAPGGEKSAPKRKERPH